MSRNNRLARFDINLDATPYTTATSPALLNATVKLTSASRINNQFNFINFTLSVSIVNLIPLQGRIISCGDLVQRSQHFKINDFFIINESYTGTIIINVTNFSICVFKL